MCFKEGLCVILDFLCLSLKVLDTSYLDPTRFVKLVYHSVQIRFP